MKKILKAIALGVSVSLSTIIFYTPMVQAKTFETLNKEQDFYKENKTEILNINGINYKYSYSYENGNKLITITNDSNNKIEKIKEDKTGNVYLNNEKFLIQEDNNIKDNTILEDENIIKPRAYAYYQWETKSYSNYYISWAKATSVAAVAGAIAVKVGTLGAPGVIAAMGLTTLGVIASQTAGGRVSVKIQMFRAPYINPQYRTVWGFKASTGDYYGNYIYNH